MEDKKVNKKALILILIVVVLVVCLVVYLITKDNTKDSVTKEEPKKTGFLADKTDFSKLCEEYPCQKNLGKVKLGEEEVTLRVDISGTKDNMDGKLVFGGNDITLAELKYLEEENIAIEGLEKYKDYLIIYSRSDEQTDGYHYQRLTMLDAQGEIVIYLDGYSCGSFRDYKITNGRLSYISMDNEVTSNKLYKKELNKNDYNVLAVTKTIEMADLLKLDMDKSSDIETIDYDCGYSMD